MSTRGVGWPWKSHTRENDRRWRREQGSKFWVEERWTFWKRRDGVWAKSDEGGWCKWNWGLETGVHFSTKPSTEGGEGRTLGRSMSGCGWYDDDRKCKDRPSDLQVSYVSSTARSDSTCKRESYSNPSRITVQLHERTGVQQKTKETSKQAGRCENCDDEKQGWNTSRPGPPAPQQAPGEQREGMWKDGGGRDG